MEEKKYKPTHLMDNLYKAPETFWELSEENKKFAMEDMQDTYAKLLKATEMSFDQLRTAVISLAAYGEFVNKIINS